MPKLFFVVLVLSILNALIASTPVQADELVVHAIVPARVSDFQLALTGPADGATVHQDADLYYRLIYGSKLSTTTDMVVLQLSWSLGRIDDDPNRTVDILQYMVGTASLGLGKANPQINTNGRLVGWTISPMPPLLNQHVDLHLLTTSTYTGLEPVYFTITARLIGPGVELPPQQLTAIYRYQPGLTPTPVGGSTSPTPTLSPSPSPTLPAIGSQPYLDGFWLELVALGVLLIGLAAFIRRQLDQVSLTSILTWISLWPWWHWTKRRWWWGQVFNQHNHPLQGIKLKLVNETGFIYQGVTTSKGRFGWEVDAGRYYLSIDDSRATLDRSSHSPQADWYDGGVIVIDQLPPHVNVAAQSLAEPTSHVDWPVIIFSVGSTLAVLGLMVGFNLLAVVVVGLYLYSWMEFMLS